MARKKRRSWSRADRRGRPSAPAETPPPAHAGPTATLTAAPRSTAVAARPRRKPSKTAPPRLAPRGEPVTRADAAWAGGVAALSAALFGSTLTGHVGLGDAPESVAGVDSLGVLHAPGYPAYVLAARAFTVVEPFGSTTVRVNLFSLVCASLITAIVYMLARRCGAVRWCSGIAALVLATGAAFWFYSGYAKHDVFSALMPLLALYWSLRWEERPTRMRLIGVALALAAGLGSSWELTILFLPAIGYILFRNRRRLKLRAVLEAGGVGIIAVAALYAFVFLRAAQYPTVNWGAVNGVGRFIDLVTLKDFGKGFAGQGGASSGSAVPGAAGLGYLPHSAAVYVAIFAQELGILAVVVAAWGLWILFRRRYAVRLPLLILFVTNLLGAGLVVGPGGLHGFDSALIHEGFVFGCYVSLTVWLALGVTDLARRLTAIAPAAGEGRSRAVAVALIGSVFAAALLIPSLVVHRPAAAREAAPLADSYAESAFAELPQGSAVFIWSAEATFPLVYRQVVRRERPDVAVIAASGLAHEWYRDEAERILHRSLPPIRGGQGPYAVAVVRLVEQQRPVYIDFAMAQRLEKLMGYRPVGLLAVPADGRGVVPVASPSTLAVTVDAAERSARIPDPVWRGWPNQVILASYEAARFEVARAYYQQRDYAGMRDQLAAVLRIDPDDPAVQQNVAALARRAPAGP
ncbi:MAG: DUF2723 domain-containing protein [Chloroflexi bacterium]|nr:MAG: DUF2723 domain-containing protein [Chloroflexota bacterium]